MYVEPYIIEPVYILYIPIIYSNEYPWYGPFEDQNGTKLEGLQAFATADASAHTWVTWPNQTLVPTWS